ncbi:MAG: phage tail protein [Clostridiales bacterium]|nr:phage tail protein [Clostridiales bacterium]
MYENMTYETILKRMLDRVPDHFDKREGSVIFDTHSPTALELQYLYIELERIIQEAYGDTASRDFLILRAKERGITPIPASNTVLRGRFTPENIDVIGQRFNVGDLNYIALRSATDGKGGYELQCETPGNIGNQQLGSMIPIQYIPGLETAELTEILVPGEDEEDTESLRKRYLDSFTEKSFGGNVQDYLEKTNAISGVGSTKVTRLWNGDIHPADLIPTAKVQTWYSGIIETLDEEVAVWLTSVYMAALEKKLTTGGAVLLTILDSDFGGASDTLINTVQQTIDPDEYAGEGYGLAPIGHIVNVKSAESVSVTVKTNITYDDGYSWSNLQSSIEQAISAYLLELRKSWADSPYLIVRVSQIETRLLQIQGVIDIDNTRINGTSNNLILGKYEVPLFGGVSE